MAGSLRIPISWDDRTGDLSVGFITTTWNTQSRNGISQSRTVATTIFEELLCQEIAWPFEVPEIEEYMYEEFLRRCVQALRLTS